MAACKKHFLKLKNIFFSHSYWLWFPLQKTLPFIDTVPYAKPKDKFRVKNTHKIIEKFESRNYIILINVIQKVWPTVLLINSHHIVFNLNFATRLGTFYPTGLLLHINDLSSTIIHIHIYYRDDFTPTSLPSIWSNSKKPKRT